ncbi:prevent-host-death protein [Candidatus Thiomargarita nelsonii]|uniref:Prevent-host-death protein n=1 Tax=Candidatus Thiomargarita nelsonii TaxID=1003181 RepID=A0A0A6P8G6_9GAMM|nr:prevent-host-death protein [Candidatus Thiomargarita nelsonii]
MQYVDLQTIQEEILLLVERASMGEDVIITKDEQPLVKLVSMTKRQRQFGSAKGLIKIADDFDSPLEEFREYM